MIVWVVASLPDGSLWVPEGVLVWCFVVVRVRERLTVVAFVGNDRRRWFGGNWRMAVVLNER